MKVLHLDMEDFKDKINCIVRNLEDNMRNIDKKILGGTVKDLGNQFIREYRKLRPYKPEWQLKRLNYISMKKPKKGQLLESRK